MNKLDKKYWTNLKFTKGENPHLKCPSCGEELFSVKGSFNKSQTAQSKRDYNQEYWDYSMVEYVFTILFECKNNKCLEYVVCLGSGDHDVFYVDSPNGDEYEQEEQDNFYPKYFLPPLNIIPLKDEYPVDFNTYLKSSFSHFFSDLSSCANKIRLCIEKLLDYQNIGRFGRNKKNQKYSFTLHERIIQFKAKEEKIANYLLAIKWIGNSGSHDDTLTKDDILDAYDLLDYCLGLIYNNREKELNKITKEINKKKAPRSKGKSKKK